MTPTAFVLGLVGYAGWLALVVWLAGALFGVTTLPWLSVVGLAALWWFPEIAGAVLTLLTGNGYCERVGR